MDEHCHKCGTELTEEPRRQHSYRVETPEDDRDALTGRLCADCVVAFEEWLTESRLLEADVDADD